MIIGKCTQTVYCIQGACLLLQFTYVLRAHIEMIHGALKVDEHRAHKLTKEEVQRHAMNINNCFLDTGEKTKTPSSLWCSFLCTLSFCCCNFSLGWLQTYRLTKKRQGY